MLKQTLLVFALFTALLTSCSKSSDDVTPETLVGTWSMTKITFNVDGKIYTPTAAALKNYDWDKLQWKIDEKTLTYLPDNYTANYTYDAAAKKLVLEDSGDKYNYSIEATGSTLKATSIAADLTKSNLNDLTEEEFDIIFTAASLLDDNTEVEKLANPKKMTMILEFKK